jgi:hypothetical protein
MTYIYDRDAGTAITSSPEGETTLNPLIYQRIPVVDIPTTPIIDPARAFHADSTGFPDLAVGDNLAYAPTLFSLYQNYPNPFNPATKIQFDLRFEGAVWLKVFDVTGREVAAPVRGGRLSAGTHVVEFNGSGLASGVYFCRLESAGITATRKMILMK